MRGGYDRRGAVVVRSKGVADKGNPPASERDDFAFVLGPHASGGRRFLRIRQDNAAPFYFSSSPSPSSTRLVWISFFSFLPSFLPSYPILSRPGCSRRLATRAKVRKDAGNRSPRGQTQKYDPTWKGADGPGIRDCRPRPYSNLDLCRASRAARLPRMQIGVSELGESPLGLDGRCYRSFRYIGDRIDIIGFEGWFRELGLRFFWIGSEVVSLEMKIGGGFHEFKIFRLAFFVLSYRYRVSLVLNIVPCSSWILFYYEMKIGGWFHEFKIFRLVMSFVLLFSWILFCTRWKLKDFTSWV